MKFSFVALGLASFAMGLKWALPNWDQFHSFKFILPSIQDQLLSVIIHLHLQHYLQHLNLPPLFIFIYSQIEPKSRE